MGSVDLVITLNWHIPEHLKQKRLYSDDFVVIFRKGHPLDGQDLTLDHYLSARHLMVSPLETAFGPIDETLTSLGHRRTLSLVMPCFMGVADALLNSDLMLTLQRRICIELLKKHPLVLKDMPVKVPPVHYFLFWHTRFSKDPMISWLREIIHKILSHQTQLITLVLIWGGGWIRGLQDIC